MRSLRVVLVLLTVFLYAEAATGSGIRRGEDCLRCLDPYKELGVPPNTDLETCRKAYHNLKSIRARASRNPAAQIEIPDQSFEMIREEHEAATSIYEGEVASQLWGDSIPPMWKAAILLTMALLIVAGLVYIIVHHLLKPRMWEASFSFLNMTHDLSITTATYKRCSVVQETFQMPGSPLKTTVASEATDMVPETPEFSARSAANDAIFEPVVNIPENLVEEMKSSVSIVNEEGLSGNGQENVVRPVEEEIEDISLLTTRPSRPARKKMTRICRGRR